MLYAAPEKELLEQMMTQKDERLLDLTFAQPVMLVFLRQLGCTFCREALADIAKERKRIEGLGTKIVLVHMAAAEVAEEFFDKFDLPGIDHISDPECNYYRSFGLGKGTFTQLFGLSTWIRGFDIGVVRGYGLEYGSHLGDSFQMPGVFILQDGEIKESYIHKLASSRPDYHELVKCCVIDA